jgi:hypothetical protein
MVKQNEMRLESKAWTPWLEASKLAEWAGCSVSAVRSWSSDGEEHFGRTFERRDKPEGAEGRHSVEYRASMRGGESWAPATQIARREAVVATVGAPGILDVPSKPAIVTPRVKVRYIIDQELKRRGQTADSAAHAELWRELYRLFELFHGKRVPPSEACKGSRLDHVVDELGMGEELYGVAYRQWVGEVVA